MESLPGCKGAGFLFSEKVISAVTLRLKTSQCVILDDSLEERLHIFIAIGVAGDMVSSS